MRPVKTGDKISIGNKTYVFTKNSANIFNIALKIKNREGRWPTGTLSIRNFTEAGIKHYKPGFFEIATVADAVEKTQKGESGSLP